jgi:DNA-binding NtrC family response regulator
VEQADGGTLFLAHAEALPPDLHERVTRLAKLQEVTRIGAKGFKLVDVRLILGIDAAAADGPLLEQFPGLRLTLPPLRERLEDLPALARHLMKRISEQPGMRLLDLPDETLTLLMSYGWPGNIRQLHDALFRAAIGCEEDSITAADLPRVALEASLARRSDDHHASMPPVRLVPARPAEITFYRPDGHLRTLEEIESDIIRLAIGRYQGRMTEVARRLGIGRSTLYRKLAELGISVAA